jgi:hypothetical protein
MMLRIDASTTGILVVAAAVLGSIPATADPNGKGMTWTKGSSNAVNGTVTVGCGNGPTRCDAYKGDTPCTTRLPLLCFLPLKAPQPTSIVSSPTNQWSGGLVGTTPPYQGNSFKTLQDANNACIKEFNDKSWRVAEFHDGWGWNFQAYGNVGTSKPNRFWVHINDQTPAATCWLP